MLARVAEVFWIFIQLGLTTFGGPGASIALFQHVIVQKRRWLEAREFMEYVSLSHLIPGPIAVQLSLHLGYRRAGLLGAGAAVLGFVLPAAFITWVCAVLYVNGQNLSWLEACLKGIRPAIVAVVLTSVLQLGKTYLTVARNWLVLSIVGGGVVLGGNAMVLLLVGAILVTIWPLGNGPIAGKESSQRNPSQRPTQDPRSKTSLIVLGTPPLAMLAQSPGWGTLSPVLLFLLFAKIGLFLYGGGSVLVAYLTNDLVETGIISHHVLLDALAVGQSTPGPILTVATFLGYLLAGTPGAIAATAGIIIPCLLLASLFHPFAKRTRSSPFFAKVFEGISVSVIGLILGTSLRLGWAVFITPIAVVLGTFYLALLTLLRVSAVQVIAAAALIGLLLSF
jgi:chromate transporter